MTRSFSDSNAKGFTLVELMIVVAIIGILAAVATPAYFNHVLRIRQTDGWQKLLDIKTGQEKFYALYSSYSGTGALATAAGTFTELLNFDPADTTFYRFTMLSGDTSTFRVIAEGDLNGDGARKDCWEITDDWSEPQENTTYGVCASDSEGFSFSLIGGLL